MSELSALLAAGCAATATAVLVRPGLQARWRTLAPQARDAGPSRRWARRSARPPRLGPWFVCTVVAVVLATVVGGLAGVLVGAAIVGGGPPALRRLDSLSDRRRDAAMGEELAWAGPLLAVALRSGAPVDRALEVVASAVDRPLREELERVVVSSRLGASPRAAWSGVHPALDELGAVLARASARGSAPADAVEELSQRLASARTLAQERTARAVGVRALLPLVCCFLPAFLVLTVIPLVYGLGRSVLRLP